MTNLYTYAFPISLVVIVLIAAFNVFRSRRRQRFMLEEAARNGLWDPSLQGMRPAYIDPTKKPIIWDAYIDGKGNIYTTGTQGSGKGISEEWRAEHATEWDAIRPLSAAYAVSGAEARTEAVGMIPWATESTTSINGLGLGQRTAPPPAQMPMPVPVASQPPPPSPNSNGNSSSRDTPRSTTPFFSRFFRRAPGPASLLPAPATSGSSTDADRNDGKGYAMTDLNSRENKASTPMRVAVLIAMPALPSPRSAPSISTGPAAHPLASDNAAHDHVHDDEEPLPLPHLEVGIAEVLVASDQSSVHGELEASGDRGKRGTRGSVGTNGTDASEVW